MRSRALVVALVALAAACGSDKQPDPTKAAPDRGPHVVWDGQVFECSVPNDCRGTLGTALVIQGVADKTLVSIGREPPVTTTVVGATIPLTVASFADANPQVMAAGRGEVKLPFAITTPRGQTYASGAPVPAQTAAAIVDAAMAGAHVDAFGKTGKAIWIAESAWGGAAIGVVGEPVRVSDIDRVIVRPSRDACEVALLDRTTGAELAREKVCERAAIAAWAKTKL